MFKILNFDKLSMLLPLHIDAKIFSLINGFSLCCCTDFLWVATS